MVVDQPRHKFRVHSRVMPFTAMTILTTWASRLSAFFAPLALPDESIDTVVVTWTLCSIPDAPRALKQMKRVLKADGRLIFIEHGRSPDPSVVAWQNRLTPTWKRIGGGCHLNRKIDDLIAGAGFQILDLRTCYLPGPRPTTYTYQGVARGA